MGGNISTIMDFNIFFTSKLLSRAAYLMWDLESCSTTLNIITTLHEYSILSDIIQPEPVLYTFILPFLYEIHILNQYWIFEIITWHITFLGTLNHVTHTTFQHYTSPFWTPWTKVTQAHMKHEILE